MIIILRDRMADSIGVERARELLALPATVVVFMRPEWGGVHMMELQGWDDPIQVKMVGGEAEQTFVAIEMLRTEHGDDTMVLISALPEDSMAAVLADIHFAGSLEEAETSFIEEAYYARKRPEQGPTPNRGTRNAPLVKGGLEAGGANSAEREGPDTT